MTEIRILPEQPTRVETGPVQFGEHDWPGVFIRGDNAAYYAHCLDAFAQRKGDVDMFTQTAVEGLVRLLRSCIAGPATMAGASTGAKRCGSCASFERNGTRYGGFCTSQESTCAGMLLSALKDACPQHAYEAKPDEVPEGYRPLAAGMRCKCPRGYTDAGGGSWCCNGTPWEKPA